MGSGGSPLFFVGAVGLGTLALLALAGGGSPVEGTRRVEGFVEGKVGQFFEWGEFIASGAASRLGLDNTPTPEAQRNLVRLVDVVLDPARERLGTPIRITSGYRAPAVNHAVRGSPSSMHLTGEAVDIKADGFVAEQLAEFLANSGLPFDQIIWYAPSRGGHVHVSYTESRQNRRQTLHAPADGGYVAWHPARREVA
jgi:zinc D-Ala-D-Ala carboxypeptidase